MLNKLLKHIKYGSLYGAIEHQKYEDGEKLALLLLKKKKNEFEIETQNQFSSFNEIVKSINKEQHLYLIVNNNQVLSKSVTKKLNESKAVLSAFPAIKIKDFYYEVLQLETLTYVSICRKEYINELMHSYKNQHINIIGFSLGNSIIDTIIPFINNSPFTTSNATIATNTNNPVSIELKDNANEIPYTINGITISNNYMLSLAGIIKYYTNQNTTTANFSEINLLSSKSYTQKRFFNTGLKIGLGLLFLLLFINFILFDFYNNKITILTEKTQINLASKEKNRILYKELEIKKKLIDDIVNSTSSKTSLYFDQLGASIPATISLNSIEYQPILKKVEDGKKVELNQHILFIKGLSTKGEDFSNWIKNIEDKSWVKSVNIIEYGTGKKIKTSFELKVILE
jgi:Tfp pilus assembly protein PilN